MLCLEWWFPLTFLPDGALFLTKFSRDSLAAAVNTTIDMKKIETRVLNGNHCKARPSG